ncbi:hypothetical protein MLD38_006241 [Melastoma candidum]|uniref:Uncharacterized protein n=1 Tax=Melastoma candidum TaxID=119954 RepID=A0ACB9RLW3_9MYRT|nr:hypothetical protein MLD38_006241 [Melastoma candidum]
MSFDLTLSTFLTIISAFTTIFLPSHPKSYYHSLFLSPSLSSNDSLSHDLLSLTRRPHVAGTPANSHTASYVLSQLTSYNIPSRLKSYSVLLTYPVSRSLTLTPSLQHPLPEVFSLQQEIYKGDPFADVAGEVLPTFHAYAKSGTATGPAVYVNYGQMEDYRTLEEMGVDVKGTIAVAKYGRIFRGDIVQNAYEAGCIGVIVYTDRKDFGGGDSGNWFPNGRWMPPTGVQVGSVLLVKGDPTTPGWASTEGCERLSDEELVEVLPKIPSLPVSGQDGETIIKSIGGKVAKDDWQGSKDGPVYRVGPGPAVLNLTYLGKQTIASIENVIGVIEGAEEPDRYVVLGNHRDAWTFGAADPNSGTATLLEVAKRLQKLALEGWKPRRTIILCNWDAEEYALIGSTEWAEENSKILISRAVAYLNVDIAVAGPGFRADATPQLDELIREAAKQVQDPDNSSQTVYDSWAKSSPSLEVGRLGGGGSDFAAFVQHLGIPAADFSYETGGYPVYHSLYDDFVWMKQFGDPGFHRHVAVASIWGLVALRLADDEILPFNYVSYATELKNGAKELEDRISDKGVDVNPLLKAIEELQGAANKINGEIEGVKRSKRQISSMWKDENIKVRELNDRLMMTERAFTDPDGLPAKPWYKHLIYAPTKHNGYGSRYFPGIEDAVEEASGLKTTDSWRAVQHQIWRVSRAIKHASIVLSGHLA